MYLQVTVYYGDYGNTSTIPMSQLRKIPAEIEHAKTLPMQVTLFHRLNYY